MVEPGGLVQFPGQGLEGLVEAKGHVPGLGGKDGKHRGQLIPQGLAGKEGGKGTQACRHEAQDRDRLEEVKKGHEKGLEARLGRQGSVAQGKEGGEKEAEPHAKGGPEGVLRKVDGVYGNRHGPVRPHRLVGGQEEASQKGHGHKARQEVVAVGSGKQNHRAHRHLLPPGAGASRPAPYGLGGHTCPTLNPINLRNPHP